MCRVQCLVVIHIYFLWNGWEKKKLWHKHDQFSKNLVASKRSTSFMHSPYNLHAMGAGEYLGCNNIISVGENKNQGVITSFQWVLENKKKLWIPHLESAILPQIIYLRCESQFPQPNWYLFRWVLGDRELELMQIKVDAGWCQ